MANPAHLDAVAYANEAWIGSLPFVEADTDTPVDLTGMAFAMQLRRRAGAATVDLKMATATGELFIAEPAAAGILSYDIPVDRVRLLSGTYHYDLLAWSASEPDAARLWLEGSVIVSPGVTR
jgi:hypothetical protein